MSTEDEANMIKRALLSLVKEIDDMFMEHGAKEWADHFHKNPDHQEDVARLSYLHSQVYTSAGIMHQGVIKSVLLLFNVVSAQDDPEIIDALSEDYSLYTRIYQMIRVPFLCDFGIIFGEPT
jgi:hypothetical protein